MRVIIFGATGGIGRHAVRHALARGHQVTAYVRSPEKLDPPGGGLRVVGGAIADRAAVSAVLEGQDAVIWCVGIPMKPRYGPMQSLEGHRVLLPAMEARGVRRLVDWATPSVPFEKDTQSLLTVVPGLAAGLFLPEAKREMMQIGELVRASGLDWTLVRFLAPKDTPYTGRVKVSFGSERLRFAISRSDIAAFMVEQLESDRYIRSMPIIGS